jgi:hypothetical protein
MSYKQQLLPNQANLANQSLELNVIKVIDWLAMCV